MVNHPDDCQRCAFVPSPNSAPGPRRSRKAQTAPNPCGSCGPPGVQTSVSIKPGMKLKETKTLPGMQPTRDFNMDRSKTISISRGHSRMRLHNAPQSSLWEQKALMLRGPDEGVTMICSSSRTWRKHGGHKNHTNIVYKARAKSMDSRILTH